MTCVYIHKISYYQCRPIHRRHRVESWPAKNDMHTIRHGQVIIRWVGVASINNYNFNNLYSVGPYLIVGTAHREVGSIDSQKIFEMTRYELIPFLTSTLHLTQSQVHILLSFPYMELGIIWYVSIYRKETIGYSLPWCREYWTRPVSITRILMTCPTPDKGYSN